MAQRSEVVSGQRGNITSGTTTGLSHAQVRALTTGFYNSISSSPRVIHEWTGSAYKVHQLGLKWVLPTQHGGERIISGTIELFDSGSPIVVGAAAGSRELRLVDSENHTTAFASADYQRMDTALPILTSSTVPYDSPAGTYTLNSTAISLLNTRLNADQALKLVLAPETMFDNVNYGSGAQQYWYSKVLGTAQLTLTYEWDDSAMLGFNF